MLKRRKTLGFGLACLGLACAAGQAHGAEATPRKVAVVVPEGRSAYSEACQALTTALALNEKLRTEVRAFGLPEDPEDTKAYAKLKRAIDAFRPDIVVPVGTAAVGWARQNACGVPAVSCMTLDAPAVPEGEKWAGTYLNVGAEDRLTIIQSAFARNPKVGVLYDPEKSEPDVDGLKAGAMKLEADLETFQVHEAKDILVGFHALRDAGCDVILGLPDSTVYGAAGTRLILRDCLRHRTVFVGISKAYARAGAVVAIYTEAADQGRQAADTVLTLLEDPGSAAAYAPPRRVRIAVNTRAAKLARARFSSEFLERVDEEYGR